MGDKISYRLQAPGFWLLPRWLKLAHPLWMETICLAAILVAVGAFYICNINPYALGPLAYDDGIYVVLAKALATGQGYRLISFPGDPPQTLYPPFYPFLLSIVWRLRPDFPENLKPMLMISSIAAVMFLLLTYGYLTRRGYAEPKFALIIVLLTALNPVTLFYATRAMSDMVYAVLAVAGLWLAEEYAEGHRRWRYGVITGVVLGLGFLTRVVNVALIVAAVIYLARKRRFKKLALVSAVALAFVIAWSIWSYVEHIRTDSLLVKSSYDINYDYFALYMLDLLKHWRSDFIKIIIQNVLRLVSHLGAVLVAFFPSKGYVTSSMNIIEIPLAFAPALAATFIGFLHSWDRNIRLMHAFVVLYLGVIALLLSEQRYLLPLLPFLLLWLISELKRMTKVFIEGLRATKTITIICAVAMALCVWMALWCTYVIYRYVHSVKIFTVELPDFYNVQWLERSKVFRWIIDNTDKNDTLVCEFDPIYYLHTGRKAVRAYSAVRVSHWTFYGWEPSETLAIIKESRAKHLIVELAPLFNYWGRRVVESEPEAFTLVFRSPNSYLLVYRVNRERL